MKYNTLSANLNLVTRQWSIIEHDIISKDVVVEFGFTSDEAVVTFKELSFGIIVVKDDIVYYKSFPKAGHSYINTDQEILEKVLVPLNTGNTYTVTFWAEDSNLRTQITYSLILPKQEALPTYEVI